MYAWKAGTVEARFFLDASEEGIECAPAADRKKHGRELAVALNKAVPTWRQIAAENKKAQRQPDSP